MMFFMLFTPVVQYFLLLFVLLPEAAGDVFLFFSWGYYLLAYIGFRPFPDGKPKKNAQQKGGVRQ
ncbi:MAG: hypothetical protein GX085_02085 [Firmicutes bacterium]|nr:hypothetical protein [Bacillota bacterium]